MIPDATPPSHPATQSGVPAFADEYELPCIDVDGLPFVAATVGELSAHICASAALKRGGWAVTPNIDILRRWRHDAGFRELVGSATLFTPDGAPIVWASRLQGRPLPGRLAGSDLFVDLYRRAAQAGLRILLIGGNPGAADEAVRVLEHRERLPAGLASTHCPPLGFERVPAEMQQIEQLLTKWQPRIVFVGLGSPKQEVLIWHLRSVLPDAWYLGVGVSFSFVAGEVRRAPKWAQQLGLEWVDRLIQEPGRLGRRYLVDGLPFAAALLWRSVRRRWTR